MNVSSKSLVEFFVQLHQSGLIETRLVSEHKYLEIEWMTKRQFYLKTQLLHNISLEFFFYRRKGSLC